MARFCLQFISSTSSEKVGFITMDDHLFHCSYTKVILARVLTLLAILIMTSLLIFAVITLVVSQEVGAGNDQVIANVPGYGRLLGARRDTSPLNGMSREYLEFLDVPYAKIPQRFAPSELLESLAVQNEIYNATQGKIYCPQNPLSNPELVMTEDCLVLNIYTNKLYNGNGDDLRPVIFLVHSGSFISGRGGDYAGARLLNKDVVLVSVNYRLGIPGFFTLENEDVPGNAGLYDVVNGLKWVQKHIHQFGGNPNLVTLAGHSAGSVLVTQLMTSPLAQGLFHRVIAASGSALNARGVTDGTPLEIAMELARRAGCTGDSETSSSEEDDDMKHIADCMRTVNVSILIKVQIQYLNEDKLKNRIGLGIIFPRPQKFPASPNFPKVLPEHPREVLERGEQSAVPFLISACITEGSFFLATYYLLNIYGKGLRDNETYVRNEIADLVLDAYGIQKDPSGVRDGIKELYFRDTQYSGNFSAMYPALVNLFSALQVKAGSYENAVLQSQVAPTFFESFEYEGSQPMWNFLTSAPGNGALLDLPEIPNHVTHNDDIFFLFQFTPNTFTEEEQAVSSRMLSYWADFAKNGKPSEDWPELYADGSYTIVNKESSIASRYPSTWSNPSHSNV